MTNGIITAIKKYAVPLVVVTLMLLYILYNQLVDLLLGAFSPQAFMWVFFFLLAIAITMVIASVAFSTYIMKEHTKEVESTVDRKITQFQSNVDNRINTWESTMDNKINRLGRDLRNQLNTDRQQLGKQFQDLLELNRKICAERTSRELMVQQLNQLREEGNIMNTTELIAFEKKMVQRSICQIWVLTRFLEIERTPDMKAAIVDNLIKGHSYTYLIPDDRKDELHDRVAEWLSMAMDKNKNLKKATFRKRVRCIIVPDHFPYMTIVVYKARKRRPEVVVKFPYREAGGEVDELYEQWMFKVAAGEDAVRIRNALKDLIDGTAGEEHICGKSKVFNLGI